MENKQSPTQGIHLKSVHLVDQTFRYQADKKPSVGLHVKMNLQNNINEAERVLESLLTFDVLASDKPEDSLFIISATIRGLFQEVPGGPIDLKKFSEINGPAILFPFVREAISSVTAKSPVGAVLLPPVNIGALVRGEIQVTNRAGQDQGFSG
jgi:preprotein translocase subunit SecB